MQFLDQIVSLVVSFNPMWSPYLNYILALCFLVTAPYVIRDIIGKWR